MFKLLNRQAVKAVPRPRLGLSLFNGTSCRMHSVRPPYTGPPSYDTIIQRFSSDINPQAYFNHKRQQEAKDRGEYIDIHDIGGPDPKDYDVLISDVDDEKLRHEISKVVGIPYHAEATKEDTSKVVEIGDCYLYGLKLRTIFPTVVAHENRAHWVFFIVDSGAPITYLSAQTSDLFGISEERGTDLINIAGRPASVSRSPIQTQFTELNLLGMDFFKYHNISQVNDFTKLTAKLYFGKEWKMVRESKL